MIAFIKHLVACMTLDRQIKEAKEENARLRKELEEIREFRALIKKATQKAAVRLPN